MDGKLQIYCINLKERPDRWQRFFHQPGLQRLIQAYPFERMEGVNGKLLDIQHDPRVSLRTKRNIFLKRRRDHEDLDSPGGVGCYLSHYNCWKQFLDSKAEYLLVLEDDALLPPKFVDYFQPVFEEFQSGSSAPDIWQLSTPFNKNINMRRSMELKDIQYSGSWGYNVLCPGTGYVIHKATAKILVNNAFPIDGHVDMYMFRCAQIGLLKIAVYEKMFLKQVSVKKKDSNIQEIGCELCNIPCKPSQKGYFIMNNQQVAAVIVASLSVATLMMLRTYK